MNKIQNYAIQVVTKLSYEDSISRVTELLEKEGFGILTEIDVKATLKKKLDLDFEPYIILGACNPQFAYNALTAEPYVGVLLPCNVIVRDVGDQRIIAALEPKMMADVIDNTELEEIAAEVSIKLHRVLSQMEEI